MRMTGPVINGVRERRTFRDRQTGNEVTRHSWKGLTETAEGERIVLTAYLDSESSEIPQIGAPYTFDIKTYERESPFTGNAVVEKWDMFAE